MELTLTGCEMRQIVLNYRRAIIAGILVAMFAPLGAVVLNSENSTGSYLKALIASLVVFLVVLLPFIFITKCLKNRD